MRTALSLTLLLVAGTATSENTVGIIASWKAPSSAGVLKPLDGADGAFDTTTKAGSACITHKPGAEPPSNYLYFALDDAARAQISAPLYLIVEYYDGTPGGAITVEYDSTNGDAVTDRYRPNEDQWGGAMAGTKRWRTAVFALNNPRCKGGENLGADFRLGGVHMALRTISLSTTAPTNLDTLAKNDRPRLLPQAHIGSGGQLVIGGFDPDSRQSALTQTRLLDAALPGLKAAGVTCHEGYVRWNLCEPEPGKYDWSLYDRYVDLYRKHGVKWVPFLIFGSAYSLPDWFYKKDGFQGYVCLEHNQESDVASLWSPALKEHLARFLQAFAKHYRDAGVIDYILLGITGNYGEAIYIASGNDWTANTHGEYHTHAGIWAGDPFAVADFRRFLQEKYADAPTISKAWGAPVKDIAQVTPFLRKDAPSDRAWLDFADWYIGAMNGHTRFWLETLRKCYSGPMEVCTGGHAPVEHGADFGMQCKIAAEYGAGVRITNECSDYRANFSLTRWVASSSRQYGGYFSFEPAGLVTPDGVVGRVYNASASGAQRLHYYYPNIFGNERARDNWVRWASEYRQRNPLVEIAVYYPETHIRLNENKFLEHVQPLRDCFDFAYRSDGQIADGGLKDIRALVLLWGATAEKATWDAITDWVRHGGLLLYADGVGRLRTVEGDESVNDALFGPSADHGLGRTALFSGPCKSTAYRRFLSETLSKAPELSRATRAMIAADGREDRVFVTATGPNTLLWYNETDQAARRRGVRLPPHSITATSLRVPHQ
jgi:hypothetical protein